MSPEIERLIMHYYPRQALVSPLEGDVKWDWDPKFEQLRAVLSALKAIDPSMRSGTRGDLSVSEEAVLFGALRVQLSYLGPYAALNYDTPVEESEHTREHCTAIAEALRKKGITVLDADTLDEPVVWVRSSKVATTWQCLFQPS